MTAIATQVDDLFLGSEFGDDELREAMRRELTERLAEGRPLRVYAGYDPTRPDLHLGHSITLRKLRRFQDHGHNVTVVVGTFTAMVGDTSDKTDQRAAVARAAIEAAATTYADQLSVILDSDRTDVRVNHSWLEGLTADKLVELASLFTVQQFQTRTNYRDRLDAGKPIGLHEFLYALFQGYDAYHLGADVQLGATEQLFNIMAGRRIQQARGQKPCVAITFPILVGTDGVERMSKSAGNYIGITEDPVNQYGKVMSVSDKTMRQWIPLVAGWDSEQVAAVLRGLDDGSLHPMACKKRLAARIVGLYHGPDAVELAAKEFERVHQQGMVPTDLPTVVFEVGDSLVSVLVASGAAKSRSEARRLVAGGGVALDDRLVADPDESLQRDHVLRVGKRRFYRVVPSTDPDGTPDT